MQINCKMKLELKWIKKEENYYWSYARWLRLLRAKSKSKLIFCHDIIVTAAACNKKKPTQRIVLNKFSYDMISIRGKFSITECEFNEVAIYPEQQQQQQINNVEKLKDIIFEKEKKLRFHHRNLTIAWNILEL